MAIYVRSERYNCWKKIDIYLSKKWDYLISSMQIRVIGSMQIRVIGSMQIRVTVQLYFTLYCLSWCTKA
jgi:hypothetical protein